MILNFPNRTVGGSYIPEADDGNIKVPNTLLPIVELPGKLSTILNGSGFTPGTETLQNESHWLTFVRTQPASSATANLGMTRLKAGLWRIYITATILKNFLPATNLDQVVLQDQNGIGAVTIIDLTAANGVVGYGNFQAVINFPVDGYEIFFQQGATGVGNSIFTTVQLLASRIA